ncbi:MAG: hypothetical protein WBG53_06675 [Rhodococcus sp. (in: high G+C Gram-positive bacteria)]
MQLFEYSAYLFACMGSHIDEPKCSMTSAKPTAPEQRTSSDIHRHRVRALQLLGHEGDVRGRSFA